MKAIRVHEFGDPEVMRLEEIPDLTPGRGQVVVSVKAAGVNPVDTYIRSGLYARRPELPYTPGTDAAGTVESVGEGVNRVSVGDRVYTAGTLSGVYAAAALCEESQVHPLPDHVTFQQGAAMGVPYGVAFRALFHRAVARPGETVLVHGATGGVGIAAVQLARAAGMTVIGSGGTTEGLELALQQGAHHVVNHRDADHLEQVSHLNRGRGVDVIIELLANVNLGQDLKFLDMGGRVVVIGSRGTVEIDPRDAMSRDASILGLVLFNASERELATIHAGLVAGLENRTLRPVISQEMPLADAPRAHKAVMESHTYGKIVLFP
ncbi:MAG: NADPH:quinone reductase [Desulfomonile tiedjei]|nr:NADPH:quinone reductase [Desulfomonile tiedjei]